MKFPDPDLDWVALLEAQGAGPEKYHMHANAHTMAFQKYVVAAKQARTSGNAERSKLLRKIGNKHKAAADALAAIANHHVDATYGLQLKKKAQLMPKKKQPVTEVTLDEETIVALDELAENGLLDQYLQMDVESETGSKEPLEDLEEEVNPIQVLIACALTEQPLDFQELVHDIIFERVSETLESLKIAIQEGVAADSDGSDEDSEESPEVRGESYRYATTEPGPEGHGTRPPMGQEHLSEPTGKKFPTGRQDVDANTLPKIGTKKKSQKGTTVAAGDTVRTQRAAD